MNGSLGRPTVGGAEIRVVVVDMSPLRARSLTTKASRLDGPNTAVLPGVLSVVPATCRWWGKPYHQGAAPPRADVGHAQHLAASCSSLFGSPRYLSRGKARRQ